MPNSFRLLALPALLAFAGCADARSAIQQGEVDMTSAGSRDLVISRVMANPVTVSDDKGEWIEIANLGADSANLKGWRISSAHDPGFTVARSLSVPPAGTVILGRSADSATNGGTHVDYVYSGVVLGNAGDWLALHDPTGATADSVVWNIPPEGEAIDRRRSATAPRPAASAAAAVAPSKELVVRVLDVGQGDAILIQNGGSTVLVDGGPAPEALGRHLDALGLNGGTVDVVILTHAHSDHYQGLRELFATKHHLAVRYFWENQDASPNVTLRKLRENLAGPSDRRSTQAVCS